MTTNNDEIMVAGQARLYLADVGSLFPIDAVVAIDALVWREVGLFAEDSMKFNTDPKFATVRSHQSDYPTRTLQTEDAATLEVDLQQWNEPNFQAVYGGGQVVEIGTAPNITYKFSPPRIGGRKEVAAIAELVDGTRTYRLCIPRTLQTNGVKHEFQKKNEGVLTLGMDVQGSDVGDPFYWLTNDPAFAAAA